MKAMALLNGETIVHRMAGGAELSCIHAYAWEEHLEQVIEDSGAEGGRIIRNDTASCLILWDSENVVSAWRGTKNADAFTIDSLRHMRRDWLTNLKVLFRRRTTFGPVHRGYLFEINSILNEVEAVRRPLTESGLADWRMGHSQGGGEALIDAVLNGSRSVFRVMTFGAPRSTGRRFAGAAEMAFGARHERITLGSDPVPRMPLPLRYTHCGTHIHFFADPLNDGRTRSQQKHGYCFDTRDEYPRGCDFSDHLDYVERTQAVLKAVQ